MQVLGKVVGIGNHLRGNFVLPRFDPHAVVGDGGMRGQLSLHLFVTELHAHRADPEPLVKLAPLIQIVHRVFQEPETGLLVRM